MCEKFCLVINLMRILKNNYFLQRFRTNMSDTCQVQIKCNDNKFIAF